MPKHRPAQTRRKSGPAGSHNTHLSRKAGSAAVSGPPADISNKHGLTPLIPLAVAILRLLASVVQWSDHHG
jgi:hypothetical protein